MSLYSSICLCSILCTGILWTCPYFRNKIWRWNQRMNKYNFSFEYFWMSNGVPLIRRIDRLERRWPFFLGFGSPLTALTLYSDNTLVQGCIFGALFPLFIIASYSVSNYNLISIYSWSTLCILQADWTSIRHINGYIPVFRIFYPSLLFTTKLSVYISEKLIGRSIRRSPQWEIRIHFNISVTSWVAYYARD